MATMLGDLLADNLRDYPGRARVARLARGPVVMTASDHDRSITVHFSGDEIAIAEGSVEDAARMVGPWLDLAQLCSGQLSPLQAVRSRRLQLHHVRRVDLLAAAGYVLSVPASYYGDTPKLPEREVVLAVVASGVAIATATVVLRARSRRRSSRA